MFLIPHRSRGTICATPAASSTGSACKYCHCVPGVANLHRADEHFAHPTGSNLTYQQSLPFFAVAHKMSGEDATAPSDYLRVKRKRTTIFLYAELGTDTVHDLRAKVNLITKVPTTDIKFFIDIAGEIAIDEHKALADQKVHRA